MVKKGNFFSLFFFQEPQCFLLRSLPPWKDSILPHPSGLRLHLFQFPLIRSEYVLDERSQARKFGIEVSERQVFLRRLKKK